MPASYLQKNINTSEYDLKSKKNPPFCPVFFFFSFPIGLLQDPTVFLHSLGVLPIQARAKGIYYENYILSLRKDG